MNTLNKQGITRARTWRDKARDVIEPVVRAGKEDGLTEAEIRRLLRPLYPFGERRWWPYKVWLDEIKVQLGTKKSPRERARMRDIDRHEPHPDQMEMDL